MGNPATLPLPQNPPVTTAPNQDAPLPSDAVDDKGGFLGHAALGALSASAPSKIAPNEAPLPADAVAGAPNPNAEAPDRGILENIAGGVEKSVIPAANELANVIAVAYEKMRGRGQSIGLSDVIHPATIGPDTEHPSIARDIGEVGGNVAQFILGDEALKSLSLADRLGVASKIAKAVEGSPKAAKALDIGMTALRQGTVGGLQTLSKGGTAEEAGKTVAATGTVSAALGGIGMAAGALYESIAKQTPEAIAEAKALAVDSGSKLANDIANNSSRIPGFRVGGGVGSAAEGAQLIKQQITAASDAMHADYAQGLHNILEKAGDVTTSIENSPLLQTAKEYATMTDVPENLQQALQNPTAQGAKVKEFVDEIANGEQTDYSLRELQGMRQVVGNKVRLLESNPAEYEARNAWINIRASIDQTIQKSLTDANMPQLAKELSDLRSVYADQTKAFESNIIQRLADGNPNTVTDVLLNKESIFNVNVLRHIIGAKNMQPVEGQLLKRLIERATVDSDFQPKSFVRNFNSLGTDVQKAIWGDNLPKIQDFLNTVRSIPKEDTRWSGLARYMEHRAIFDVALGGAAFGGIFGYGEVKGERLLVPSAIVAGMLMLHSAAALNTASKILRGASAATVPVVAGTLATPTNSQDNQEPNPTDQSENQLELPPGYAHVRASDGGEFYVPQEHLSRAQEMDTGLQLLRQSGTRA